MQFFSSMYIVTHKSKNKKKTINWFRDKHKKGQPDFNISVYYAWQEKREL